MVKSLSVRVSRLLLPFAVPDEDRGKPFTEEMELATIFCLAESEKGKGGVLKKGEEEIVFVAKACYPLWIVPWEGRNVLFDGINIINHQLSYEVMPDIQVFNDEVRGSAETRETYSAVLSDHLNYFQGFLNNEEKTIDGLITGSDFIKDLKSYFLEAKAIRRPLAKNVVLSPVLDKSAVSSSINELSDHYASLKKDVKSLRDTMKLLGMATKKRVRALNKEIKSIQKEFDKKISRTRTSVAKKRREIKRKYDQEVTKLSRNFEQQLQIHHQGHVKVEKERQRINAEINRCEAELRSSRINKNEADELKWRQRLDENRKILPALEKKLKDLEKKLESINANKRLELSKFREEYNSQVEAASLALRDIEALREAETRIRKREIELLENQSSTIVNHMDKLMKEKEVVIKEIEALGVSKIRKRYTIVYLPFYLACFQRDMKKRYVVFSPSFVCGMGVLTKFRSIFGTTKIRSLLEHRSKPITNLLNQVVPLIERNPVFENEVSEAGVQVNILRSRDARESIRRGLEDLKSEEWISENEFSQLLSIVTN